MKLIIIFQTEKDAKAFEDIITTFFKGDLIFYNTQSIDRRQDYEIQNFAPGFIQQELFLKLFYLLGKENIKMQHYQYEK